jgi:multiple sugar transport system permease protein
LLGLDIALVAFQLPLSILIMYRLMNSIPRAIDEAAYLDGAGSFRIFMQVILPISRSGLASSAAVTFILVWNEFLFVLVLAGNKILTMPLVIASFQTDKAILWGSIAASSVISLVPILLILIGLQRQIISGLSSGSVIE